LDTLAADPQRPLAILAETTKGKGVSFLQDSFVGHNSALTEAQHHQARREITERLQALEA
jgi:transketolase